MFFTLKDDIRFQVIFHRLVGRVHFLRSIIGSGRALFLRLS